MADLELTASTSDGNAVGRLLTPDTGSALPLVVFLADAGGIRPAMVEMAGHLTGAGYAVLMPDPYWRQAPFAPFDPMTVFSDPPERARLMKMIQTMKTSEWIDDTVALAARIEDPRVVTERLGVIGYCMGGRAAFLCAATLGDRVAAASCLHAGGLVGDSRESPHEQAGQVKARVYLGVADQDPSCTPEHQRTLRAALDGASVDYEMVLYEGARHGFAVPDFPVYDQAAAARSWEASLALFGSALRQ